MEKDLDEATKWYKMASFLPPLSSPISGEGSKLRVQQRELRLVQSENPIRPGQESALLRLRIQRSGKGPAL